MDEFFKRSDLDVSRLAALINVNPLTVKRWLNSERPESPTSTAFLVLLPLILAERVDVLPDVDPAVLKAHADTVRTMRPGESELDENEMKQLSRSLKLILSKEVQASRALFAALAKAWKKIDTPVPPMADD